MTEKEGKLFRNLSLVQNIMICLNYVLMLLGFVVLQAALEGVFDDIAARRQGEIDDVVGWGIIWESFGGFIGGLALIVMGFVLFVFTVWQILMWLMFWKANRRTRPVSKRKPWGIADQICKILWGVFGLRIAGEGVAELFYVETVKAADVIGAGMQTGVSLFFLITGIYLLILLCRKREAPIQETLQEAAKEEEPHESCNL